jgi:hypothetical protein
MSILKEMSVRRISRHFVNDHVFIINFSSPFGRVLLVPGTFFATLRLIFVMLKLLVSPTSLSARSVTRPMMLTWTPLILETLQLVLCNSLGLPRHQYLA